MLPWSNGRIAAFQAAGTGSTPVGSILFCLLRFSFFGGGCGARDCLEVGEVKVGLRDLLVAIGCLIYLDS